MNKKIEKLNKDDFTDAEFEVLKRTFVAAHIGFECGGLELQIMKELLYNVECKLGIYDILKDDIKTEMSTFKEMKMLFDEHADVALKEKSE